MKHQSRIDPIRFILTLYHPGNNPRKSPTLAKFEFMRLTEPKATVLPEKCEFMALTELKTAVLPEIDEDELTLVVAPEPKTPFKKKDTPKEGRKKSKRRRSRGTFRPPPTLPPSPPPSSPPVYLLVHHPFKEVQPLWWLLGYLALAAVFQAMVLVLFGIMDQIDAVGLHLIRPTEAEVH